MKIYAVSDLHIDYRPNFDWLLNLSRFEFRDDVLIVAGDLSDKLDKVEACFKHLSLCFKQVLYVPGNHDLWVGKNKQITSFDKFQSLMQMADAYNILTKPYHVQHISIVPLMSWYDFSFGECSDYLKERWMDFYMCHWGEGFEHLEHFSGKAQSVNDYFLSMNEAHLNVENETIISFSHFMPRIDVMPNYIPEIHQKLYPILGGWQLDKQVRKLGSAIHVYGHSHLNRHEIIEGVTYINNAYGNPGEEIIAAKKLKLVFSF